MNKGLFPSMKPVVGFNKEERDYLKELLWDKLIDLACSTMEVSRKEEAVAQGILDKLKD